MTEAEKSDWWCSWCGDPSHEPAPNELITCPRCGTNGVTDRRPEQPATIHQITGDPLP